jgi:hypothetical protein
MIVGLTKSDQTVVTLQSKVQSLDVCLLLLTDLGIRVGTLLRKSYKPAARPTCREQHYRKTIPTAA